MLDTRELNQSLSFDTRADSWAQSRGIISSGGVSTILPEIIGVPSGSVDLGAFDIGIINSSRTIKQALQDLETAAGDRLVKSQNLADIANKVAARNNLELGGAATREVGVSGAVIPLLSGENIWSGKQTFNAALVSNQSIEISGTTTAASSLTFFAGVNRRWVISKSNSAETGSNVGSDFTIARYADNGTIIENAISISRSTGVVTLGKPLPVGSGGTGASDVASFKSTLGISNVNNTSDLDKPVSTATNTALTAKLDKVGGTISGNLIVSGYVRSATNLLIDGNSSEGGQLVLGYRNVTNITGQNNGTWNVDVDSSNSLRIFTVRENGSAPSPYLTITETGSTSIQNVTVTGSGTLFRVTGSGGAAHGMNIQNLGTSGSVAGTAFIDFSNENTISVASVVTSLNTNGSSKLAFNITAAGSRTADRRIEAVTFDSTEAKFNVPINGRAYLRRSDGSDLNIIGTLQSGTPGFIYGSNDGTNIYPYNPSGMSVGKLATFDGGNGGGYIRRTNDPAGNGSYSNQLIVAGNDPTNDVWSNPIQIREVNLVAAGQSASTYAPGITFHWSGRGASAIKMHSDGSIRFQQQNTTLTYQTIYTGDVYSSGTLRQTTDSSLFWQTRGRGINVSDANGSYGQITTWGNGANGWAGYSIGTWASFMADGTEVGIYSQQYGNWLVRFDSSRNAIFAQNVTAYSDERLKQNKRPIDNVAMRRQGLASASIIYERDGKTHIGFGAQTLRNLNPELVSEDDDLTQTLRVCYSEAIPILAVDQQQMAERLELSESRYADLEAKYNALVARLESAGL